MDFAENNITVSSTVYIFLIADDAVIDKEKEDMNAVKWKYLK